MRRLDFETQDVVTIKPPGALEERFNETVANDLNIPSALALTWEAVREANRKRGYEVEDTPSGTRWIPIGRA